MRTGSRQETKERRVNKGKKKSAKNGSHDTSKRRFSDFFDFFFNFLLAQITVVSVSLLMTESENRRLVRITMDATLSTFVS